MHQQNATDKINNIKILKFTLIKPILSLKDLNAANQYINTCHHMVNCVYLHKSCFHELLVC